jgi:carbamoyltransferase
MDCLAIGNYILHKKDQPHWQKDDAWKQEFELD